MSKAFLAKPFESIPVSLKQVPKLDLECLEVLTCNYKDTSSAHQRMVLISRFSAMPDPDEGIEVIITSYSRGFAEDVTTDISRLYIHGEMFVLFGSAAPLFRAYADGYVHPCEPYSMYQRTWKFI